MSTGPANAGGQGMVVRLPVASTTRMPSSVDMATLEPSGLMAGSTTSRRLPRIAPAVPGTLLHCWLLPRTRRSAPSSGHATTMSGSGCSWMDAGPGQDAGQLCLLHGVLPMRSGTSGAPVRSRASPAAFWLFDRADGDAQHLGGLALGQVLEVAQHQHRALPRRQARQ